MSEITGEQILDLPMEDNDANARTVREYLVALASVLWEGGEDLVKRPFGNSGWQGEPLDALIKAGLLNVDKLEYGEWEDYDAERRKGHEMISKAIDALGKK